jgi:hypothetical protein
MSERSFPTALETALSADEASLALLVYIDWPSSPQPDVRFWTGVGDITYDSETWTGTGDLGHIDKIADSLQKNDIGIELTFNYLNDDLRNEVVTTDPVGSDASIYLALLDNATRTVTAAYEIFPGFVDEVEIVDGGDSGSVKVRLASELARMARPVSFALSDSHQKDIFPGDKGMEFATRMDEQILWGRKASQPRSGGGGSGGRRTQRR